MRVGREEKISVKVVKTAENCMVCGTVHMNITQIVITMTQRDRRLQSTSIPLNRRLHERQSRNGRFGEKNVSPAGSRTMIPRSLQHVIQKHPVNNFVPAC